MPKYSIYSEGYAATGDSACSMFHGYSEGKCFIEAVKNFKGFSCPELVTIKGDKAYYWGCRLFNNAVDAAKSFG